MAVKMKCKTKVVKHPRHSSAKSKLKAAKAKAKHKIHRLKKKRVVRKKRVIHQRCGHPVRGKAHARSKR